VFTFKVDVDIPKNLRVILTVVCGDVLCYTSGKLQVYIFSSSKVIYRMEMRMRKTRVWQS
jgi:hypothetical protein